LEFIDTNLLKIIQLMKTILTHPSQTNFVIDRNSIFKKSFDLVFYLFISIHVNFSFFQFWL